MSAARHIEPWEAEFRSIEKRVRGGDRAGIRARYCGQLCGRGGFHLMEKADGREIFPKNLEY
jgi:hypothetical protein